METLELKDVYQSKSVSVTAPINEEELNRSVFAYAQSYQFSGVQISLEPIKLAGGLLGIEVNKKEPTAIIIQSTVKKLKNLKAFIRFQQFGGLSLISVYWSISSSLFDKSESMDIEHRLEGIKEKLNGVSFAEYFEAFTSYIDGVYYYIQKQYQ